MTKYSGLEIAVIGMSARFPNAKNIAQYWQNIENGHDCISDFTIEELIAAGVAPELIYDPSYIKSGGYLADKQYFDHQFFDYKPNEAELLDPQIRIFHECCWEALEDSGYNSFDYPGKIGLYGTGSNNLAWEIYARLKNRELMLDEYNVDLLSSIHYLCSRVSYKLNLRGPSLFLHTACSSSLLAINKACTALLMGECSLAIAGGVSLINNSKRGYLYQDGMIYSKDGRCKPFDADSSGTIGGEGSGVVILKKLKDAIADGDHIYAVIKGSAVNNDGNDKVGFTAPSIKGQRDVIIKAQRMAGVHPDTIGFIETHGTATNLGDPIEIEALNEAFQLNGSSLKPNQCAIGSVKANIGHLDTTAGMASFIKMVLALKHAKIPPCVNFKEPNPKINFKSGPFYVSNKLQEWPVSSTPLRAGVSSFGIGGTNVHLILEQFEEQFKEEQDKGFLLLPFSAKSSESLNIQIKAYSQFLNKNDLNMADVAYTLQVGRMHFDYRKVLIVKDKEEALLKLNDPEFLYSEALPKISGLPNIVFMFPGQGAQYTGMYKSLYDQQQEFKTLVDQCFVLANKHADEDLYQIWLGTEVQGELNDIHLTQFTQPLLFIFEYSLAQLLIGFGIQPNYLIGHSLGEYVAACLSGVFTLDEAIKLVVARGKLIAKTALGAMLSIQINPEKLLGYLKEFEQIEIAAINSDSSVVVSGTGIEIDALERKLNLSGHLTKRLLTKHGFHSHLMEPILNDFEQNFESITPGQLLIPFISNVTGTFASFEQVGNAAYWKAQIRKPVDFLTGINKLMAFENTIFLELGPGNTLINLIRENSQLKKTHTLINTVRNRKQLIDDQEYLLGKIGQLWLNGAQINWTKYTGQHKRSRVSLPTYVFAKSEFEADIDIERLLGIGAGIALIPSMEIKSFEATADNADTTSVTATGLVTGVELPIEDKLQQLFENIFGREGISPFDNFFEIGGDSITAIQLKNLIFRELKINISINEIFENPVIHDLSVLIKSLQRLSANGINQLEESKRESSYAASSAQKRIYFKQVLDNSSTVFNISAALKTNASIDAGKLKKSLNQLVQRHESLRTSFHLEDGNLLQQVETNWELNFEHLTGMFSTVEEAFKNFVRPFDLADRSLVRFGLMEENQNSILFIDVHHLVCDGLSLNILISDFCELFMDRVLPATGVNYIDYSIWQAENLDFNAQKDYWKAKLSGNLPQLDFPKLYAKKSFSAHQASSETLRIKDDLYQAVKKVAKVNETTDFMLLMAISKVLLSKLSGNRDVIIGTDASGRSLPEFENIVGTFVNILPIRTFVTEEDTFEAFLNQVKQQVMDAYHNQDIQFDEMIGLVAQPSFSDANPIFDIHFSFSNTFSANTQLAELQLWPLNLDIQATTEYDLKIEIREAEGYFDVVFIYNNEVYEKEFIQILTPYFKQITTAISTDKLVRIADLAL